MAEEASHTNGRNGDRAPREEIAPPVKRSEKSDAQSAIRHSIQHAVGYGYKKEEAKQSPPLAAIFRHSSEFKRDDQKTPEQSEQNLKSNKLRFL